METTQAEFTFTRGLLRRRLAQHRITQVEFARVCGMYQSDVSAMLRGRCVPGPVMQARVKRGIIALRLYEPAADSEDFRAHW